MRGAWVALTPAMLTVAMAYAGESPLLAMFDTNHDGKVALAEYQTYMDQGFHRLDRNGDGILDANEQPPGRHRHGPLTLEQHHRHVARQFHRQDTNHDGFLDLEELMAPPR